MNKDEVYEKLRQDIITNLILPGEMLNEKELMKEFQIGRTPLREVFIRLQGEELLKSLPRLGYMVTVLDISEVWELIELRRELEGFVGSLAAKRINKDEIAELKEILNSAETEKQNQVSNHNITGDFDTRFHLVLYEVVQNRKLKKVLLELNTNMLRIWFHKGFNKIDHNTRKDDLTLVLNALEAGDSAKAKKALENHVEMFANQMNKKFMSE